MDQAHDEQVKLIVCNGDLNRREVHYQLELMGCFKVEGGEPKTRICNECGVENCRFRGCKINPEIHKTIPGHCDACCDADLARREYQRSLAFAL